MPGRGSTRDVNDQEVLVNSCDWCGAETTNGLALCTNCRELLIYLLGFVPIYYRNLNRWKPSSAASERRSSKSKSLVQEMARVLETGRPFGKPNSLEAAASFDRIGRLLDETHAEYVGWLRALANDRPQLEPVIARILTFDEERTVRLACALLVKRVDTLTTLPWIRDLVYGVVESEKTLRVQTARDVPGWYAGECRWCKAKTYVTPGLSWVTCQVCDATTAARDHLEIILDEARGWTARPKPLAEALVALLDNEQSVPRLYARIRQWAQREKIPAVVRHRRAHVFDGEQIVIGTEQMGHAKYRLGDVLDVLSAEGATRLPVQKVAAC
jgi:hypothetical protein